MKFLSAYFNSRTQLKKLPVVDKVSTFWNYIESLLEQLECCDNLVSSQALEARCPKCSKPNETSPEGMSSSF